MNARHKVPSARVVRKAVDTLAGLGPDVLAHLAEAILERLDAAEADVNLEPDDADGCEAEDAIPPDRLGLGDADDAEPGADDEPTLGTPIDPDARVLHGLDDGREYDPADDRQADGAPVSGPAECGGLYFWSTRLTRGGRRKRVLTYGQRWT